MQVVDVDVIGLQPCQAVFEPLRKLGRSDQPVVLAKRFLGRHNDHIARDAAQPFADDRFGAIGFGGVDDVDAQIDRAPHDRDRLRSGGAAALAKPAMAPTTKPKHTRL